MKICFTESRYLLEGLNEEPSALSRFTVRFRLNLVQDVCTQFLDLASSLKIGGPVRGRNK